jgi:Domain of Unknown Function with PDB structure (DUF3857)/Transglutaminase-like superfamily
MRNNLTKHWLKLIVWGCVFTNNFSAYAQSAQKIADSRKLFADANAIYLHKSREFIITLEKGELVGKCNIHEQLLINKEAGIGYNSKEIGVSSFIEASNINAKTLIPNKDKYITKQVEKIEFKDDISNSSFYDDGKAYKFLFPSVEVGAILDVSYQLNYKELRFMGSAYWSDYLPVVENEVIIRVQKGIDINFKEFNYDNANITFTKEELKNEVVFKWVRHNAKPIQQYGNAPNFRHFEPHMVFYITNYKTKDSDKQLLGTTKELYSWYCNLQKNVNTTENERLKEITDSLVKGITIEKEKVRAIFYWVQDNISYIAIEDGLGGFIARDAALVCHRKYGDCKDMASIICEMLKYAGIKGYPTWIGTRMIPYTYAEVPTAAADNHMIASYKDENGNWMFLDATGKKAPLELHTSMIQGKEALIGISPCDSFLIVNVPVKDTSVSQTIDSVTLTINNETVFGVGNVTLSGYDGLDYTYATERMTSQSYQDYFRSYFSKGSNKVKFGKLEKPTSLREAVKIKYDFELLNYARVNQNEIYINLNIDNSTTPTPLPEERKIPVEFDNKNKYILVTTLVIPKGYTLESIPENMHEANKLSGFSSTYTVKDGTLIHTTSYHINTFIVDVKDFAKYNSIINARIQANKQVVTLIKK